MILHCILYLAAGLAAGAVTGFTGLAPAVLLIPVLAVLGGMDGYLAGGIAMACGAVSSGAAAYNCGRQGHIRLKETPLLLIIAAIFTFLGSLLGSGVPHSALGSICVFLLPLIGLKLLFLPQSNLQSLRSEQPRYAVILETVLIGLVIGLVAGCVGVGSSELLISTLTVVLCYDIREATGTGLVLLACLSLIGCISHITLAGWPDPTALVLCTFSSFVGTVLALRVTGHMPSIDLNRGTGWALLIIGAVLLIISFL